MIWKNSNEDTFRIYFTKSTNGGASWQIPVEINTVNTLQRGNPSFITDSLFIGVVWYDRRGGEGGIYFSKSTDGGDTWFLDARIDDDISEAKLNPSIAKSDSLLYVVWEDHRDFQSHIYFVKSQDYGETWSAPIMICEPLELDVIQDSCGTPSIKAVGGNIYVAWQLLGLHYPASGTEEQTPTLSPVSLELFPNPCQREVVISYTLPNSGKVSLSIYDVSGRLVERIVKGEKSAGTHLLLWEGKRGIYFLRLKYKKASITRKFLVF